MPFGLQLALFIRYYGAQAWRNSTYPTRDKVIPFRLFYFLNRCLEPNIAYEQVGQILTTSIGVGQGMGGKGVPKLNRIVDGLMQQGLGAK